MEHVIELVSELGDLPIAYLAVFLAFAAMALAAFAIYAVMKGSHR